MCIQRGRGSQIKTGLTFCLYPVPLDSAVSTRGPNSSWNPSMSAKNPLWSIILRCLSLKPAACRFRRLLDRAVSDVPIIVNDEVTEIDSSSGHGTSVASSPAGDNASHSVPDAGTQEGCSYSMDRTCVWDAKKSLHPCSSKSVGSSSRLTTDGGTNCGIQDMTMFLPRSPCPKGKSNRSPMRPISISIELFRPPKPTVLTASVWGMGKSRAGRRSSGKKGSGRVCYLPGNNRTDLEGIDCGQVHVCQSVLDHRGVILQAEGCKIREL